MRSHKSTFTCFKRFLSCDDGSTAIEYGLIVSLLAIALIGTFTQLGTNLNETLDCSKGVIQGQDKATACD